MTDAHRSGAATTFAGFLISLVGVSQGQEETNPVLDADPRGFPQTK
jgi:hypothetical protein